MKSIILQTATRLVLPLLVLYSIFLLWQGHHRPGGGFIGGLIVAAAVGLCALVFDVPTARRLLPLPTHLFVGLGLLTAASSGLWGVAKGKPFLTGLWTTLPLPGQQLLDVGTPLLFDFGVYLVVVGVVSAILLALAEE